jgi:hypothetical protein
VDQKSIQFDKLLQHELEVVDIVALKPMEMQGGII